jgi:GH25 family lysozyme M1 (1,4-beta-N-acetylmuramidase)
VNSSAPARHSRPRHRKRTRMSQRPLVRFAATFCAATAVTAAIAIPVFVTQLPHGNPSEDGGPVERVSVSWPSYGHGDFGTGGLGHPTGVAGSDGSTYVAGEESGSDAASSSADDSAAGGDWGGGDGDDRDSDGDDRDWGDDDRDDGRAEDGDARRSDSDASRGDSDGRARIHNPKADPDRHVNMNGRIRVLGMDVSSYQPQVDWDHWWRQGKRFVFIKATEGTNYTSETFTEQWEGAGDVGMLRGAYHFALPDGPSGAAQARFFVRHGGGSRADGRTLPGVLDIEFGEAVGRPTCYNRSADQIVSWTHDFLRTYKKLTGRTPIIYSNATWWAQCTGDSQAFAKYPLWLASYNPAPGQAPGGWRNYTFWQYTDTPLDQNYFKGPYERLQKLTRR